MVLLAQSDDDDAPGELAPAKAEAPEAGQDDSPRASLEALSRLHQELIEQEAARVPEAMETPSTEPAEAPVEIVDAAAIEPVAPPSAEAETAAEEPRHKFSTELFEIAIKTFSPAKPAPIGGEAFPSNAGPLLPNLKFLPLRPKVALATGYVPPTKASVVSDAKPAETKPADKPASPAATPVRTPAPLKPASGKPPARLTQPKQPSQPAKPVQPAVAKTAEARTSTAPKGASPNADATKPAAKPVASQPVPAQEAGARPKVPDAAQKPAAAAPQPAADKAKPIAETAKPAADKPKPATDKTKPAMDKAKPAEGKAKTAPDQTDSDIAPHFGIAQPENIPWAGSLKVKLGIAIVLLLIACIYFLGWGGHSKTAAPANSNPAAVADGAGPSIIMGEGGWVEGWAGDPNGTHAGRQITIYRPSLKLSDYRMEFQGRSTPRASGGCSGLSDPDNYYAMKLMLVSSGLSPKVALFKYLVSNGRQTQVGRVPIDRGGADGHVSSISGWTFAAPNSPPTSRASRWTSGLTNN